MVNHKPQTKKWLISLWITIHPGALAKLGVVCVFSEALKIFAERLVIEFSRARHKI
jgi:hypothetical protein